VHQTLSPDKEDKTDKITVRGGKKEKERRLTDQLINVVSPSDKNNQITILLQHHMNIPMVDSDLVSEKERLASPYKNETVFLKFERLQYPFV
jgi:hypothetical protein